jgi:S1-C subfamily serine protease
MDHGRKKIIVNLSLWTVLYVALGSLVGCAGAAERLKPPVSTAALRIGDIEKVVGDDPLKALYLLSVFKRIYGTDQGETTQSLSLTAKNNLKDRLAGAIRDKQWVMAASYARSLSAIGIQETEMPDEAALALLEAKALLDKGETLGAFLAAVRSDRLRPLGAEDSQLFLKKAVEARQRRTAGYFLRAALRAGVSVDPGTRTFAEGKDSAEAMIKGVATVWVDRGIKIEKGRGFPDIIIGSAFFVDASGLLITNYHVISSEVDPKYNGYSKMYIRMGDSTSPRIPAKVIGWDQAMDLAVIKAEIQPEYVFSVVDGVVPQIGETVLAIGSPAGLEKTVTSGIVSALGRRLLPIGDVIQIDAAVNHGNSGGPVIDSENRLVGVVFAGITQFQGLNFAVPAERLAAALPAMLRGGKVERPWLGLVLSEERDNPAIVYVAPQTPASEQRVVEGTTITRLGGQEVPQGSVNRITALQDLLFYRRPGELVTLDTSDGGHYLLLTAVRPPVPLLEAAKRDTKERMAAPLYGLIISPSFGGPLDPQYLVKKVVRGSVADEAGFSENDSLSIGGFRLDEDNGVAYLDITVKKRRMGYLETSMRLPALLDSPDTL